GAPARPPSSPSRRPSRAAPAQRSRRRGMRGRHRWSSSARRPRARRARRRSSRPGRARAAAESPRACTPTPRGPSGRLRRRCLALRAFGSACLPQPHPTLELFRLVTFVVSVRHVPLVLAEMLVHAGAVLVVLLAVPLVAVLAQVALRQLRLELSYIPQKGSSFRLIAQISSSAESSSWVRSVRPRSARASASGRSTYRTSPPLICRPIVMPSTEIATSCPWLAPSRVFSPLRIVLM